MEVQWEGRNIQLSTLVDFICQFFRERSFTVSLTRSNTSHHVVVKPRRAHKIAENIHVSVDGKPDNFTVKFNAGRHSQVLVMFGALTTYFGGGSFHLKGVKSKEALRQLEREFWFCLTEKISRGRAHAYPPS